MPVAPKRTCRKCGQICQSSYCPQCLLKRNQQQKKQVQQYDRDRGTRTERGYDNRWLKVAKDFKKENPLCVMCERIGIVTLAQCVDHIVPHKGNMELFWDRNNWQGLCFKHHSEKTAKEDGGFGNIRR